MNFLTVLIIILFGLGILWGYFRGMFKMLYKVVAFLLAIAISHFLAPVVSDFIVNNTTMDDYIKSKIESRIRFEAEQQIRAKLAESLSGMSIPVDDAMVNEALGQELTRNEQIEMLRSLRVPEFAKNALIEHNYDASKASMGVTNFYDYIATYVTRMVVNAIAFAITWILSGILLILILYIITLLTKLPVISGVDHFGGMVLGFVSALLVVWLLLAIAGVMAGDGFADTINASVKDSPFLSALNKHNLFMSLIGHMTEL